MKDSALMIFLENSKLNSLLQKLRCPFCDAGFMISENKMSFICKGTKPHCLDIAASGYVNFAIGKNDSGDSREAVSARTHFLSSGAYQKFAENLSNIVEKFCGDTKTPFIIDAGCGQGYYTNMIAKNIQNALVCGVDLSKQAILTASKSSAKLDIDNAFYMVGGIYDLPFDEGSADVVVNLFAPCANEEFFHILKKDGILVVGSAGKEHLLQLKKAVYDTVYENEERADMPSKMQNVLTKNIKYNIFLNSTTQIQDLFAMTPYVYRTSSEDLQKLKALKELTTTVDFNITVYKKV